MVPAAVSGTWRSARSGLQGICARSGAPSSDTSRQLKVGLHATRHKLRHHRQKLEPRMTLRETGAHFAGKKWHVSLALNFLAPLASISLLVCAIRALRRVPFVPPPRCLPPP